MKPLLLAVLLPVTVLATDARLAWNASENATSYRLYESTDGGGNFLLVDATSDTTLVHTMIFPASKYYVTAVNDAGESSPSNTIELLVFNPPAIENGVITISWLGEPANLESSDDGITWGLLGRFNGVFTTSLDAAKKFYRLR